MELCLPLGLVGMLLGLGALILIAGGVFLLVKLGVIAHYWSRPDPSAGASDTYDLDQSRVVGTDDESAGPIER